MNYTVDFFPKASRELIEAREWYEKKQPGLGKRFDHEINSKFALIESNPLHYPLKNGFHEAVIEAFPYLLVYKFIANRKMIIITSVFHMSRHPTKKHYATENPNSDSPYPSK